MSKSEKDKKLDTNKNKTYNDDVSIEAEETFESSGAELKVKKLKEKLQQCLKENRENLLGWQRARADFVNAKKENEQKIKESFSFAKGELIEELLPVIDSFEMAFADKDAWEKVEKNWRLGVEYIYTQLLSILERNGLKPINPLGDRFDPNFHTSIETIETDNEKEDDTVVEVIQKGYECNGRVIRAARVKVAKYVGQ